MGLQTRSRDERFADKEKLQPKHRVPKVNGAFVTNDIWWRVASDSSGCAENDRGRCRFLRLDGVGDD